MAGRGRLTGSRVEIPTTLLSPHPLHSKEATLFSPDEIAAWNGDNAALLDLYGLRLASCRRIGLRPPLRSPRGDLEIRHRARLMATAALAALAVAARGRGALLHLPPDRRVAATGPLKIRNDRAAASAVAEGIHALNQATRPSFFEVAIGEGVRE